MAGVRWAVRPTTVIFNFSCQWVASLLRATLRSAVCFVLDFPHTTTSFLLDSRGASRQNFKFAGPCFAKISGRTFLRRKRPGRGVDHLPPSSAEAEERVPVPPLNLYGMFWIELLNLQQCFAFVFPKNLLVVPRLSGCITSVLQICLGLLSSSFCRSFRQTLQQC
jgi:hypothetical protein